MRIKEFRKQLGLSQEKLAKLVGVKQATVSQWESGISQPSLRSVRKIAHVFQCTIDELLGGKDRI